VLRACEQHPNRIDSWQHAIIERWYQIHFPPLLREYEIPRSGMNGTNGFADLVDPDSPEIWDIAHPSERASEKRGHVRVYVRQANQHCHLLGDIRWQLGTRLPGATIPSADDPLFVVTPEPPGVLQYAYGGIYRNDSEARERRGRQLLQELIAQVPSAAVPSANRDVDRRSPDAPNRPETPAPAAPSVSVAPSGPAIQIVPALNSPGVLELLRNLTSRQPAGTDLFVLVPPAFFESSVAGPEVLSRVTRMGARATPAMNWITAGSIAAAAVSVAGIMVVLAPLAAPAPAAAAAPAVVEAAVAAPAAVETSFASVEAATAAGYRFLGEAAANSLVQRTAAAASAVIVLGRPMAAAAGPLFQMTDVQPLQLAPADVILRRISGGAGTAPSWGTQVVFDGEQMHIVGRILVQ
jgi:hypothetical protein